MSAIRSALQFGSSTGFKMKFLVLLVSVAVASASLIGDKDINIKEDGTTLINSKDGKLIYITKQLGPFGQKNIEIEVTGPNDFDETSQDNTFNKNQNQLDILDAIFRGYLGQVDDYTFQQLLNKVHKAVLNGHIDSQVWETLQASVEDTKWKNLVPWQNLQGGGLLNKMTPQNQEWNGYFSKVFRRQSQDFNDIDNIFNVLMKIFDRQVLRTIYIRQQQMYNQEMYGQYSNEKMWDMVLSFQGVFDHRYLLDILNNKVLRNIFVQQGLFNKNILAQIYESYVTEGTYNPILLEQLVNTQMLKQILVNRGISVRDVLRQTFYSRYEDTTYNKDVSEYNMLEKIISQPMWRNVLVQYGIFNKNILDLILYRFNMQGVFDPMLLRQLVDKRALYSVLTQYGIVDESILRQFVENEFLGLNFLYKINFFQQTPRMTYNSLFGVYSNTPKYGNMQMNGENFLKSMLFGYKSGPTSYRRFYPQYQLTQQVE